MLVAVAAVDKIIARASVDSRVGAVVLDVIIAGLAVDFDEVPSVVKIIRAARAVESLVAVVVPIQVVMSCFVQRRDDFQIFLPRYIFVESDCAFAFDVNQHRRVVAPYRRPLVGDDQRSVVVEAFERVVAARVDVSRARAPFAPNVIIAFAAADGDVVPALDSDEIVASSRVD